MNESGDPALRACERVNEELRLVAHLIEKMRSIVPQHFDKPVSESSMTFAAMHEPILSAISAEISLYCRGVRTRFVDDPYAKGNRRAVVTWRRL